MRKKKNISKYLFVLPGFCFFAFAMLIPFCMGFHIAFTDWDGVGIKYNFVGSEKFSDDFSGHSCPWSVSEYAGICSARHNFRKCDSAYLSYVCKWKIPEAQYGGTGGIFYTGPLKPRADRVCVGSFCIMNFFRRSLGGRIYSAVQSMLFSALLSSASGIRLVQIC